MLQGGSRIICIVYDMFPGLDLYHAHPAQHIIPAGEEPDDLDRDLSDLYEMQTLLLLQNISHSNI